MQIIYIKGTAETSVVLIINKLTELSSAEFNWLKNKKLQDTSGFSYMCFE